MRLKEAGRLDAAISMRQALTGRDGRTCATSRDHIHMVRMC